MSGFVVGRLFFQLHGFHVAMVCFHGYLRAEDGGMREFQVKTQQSSLVLLTFQHFS